MIKRILIVYIAILLVGFLSSGYIISNFIQGQMLLEIKERLKSDLVLLQPIFDEKVDSPEDELAVQVQKLALGIQARLTIIAPDGRVIADSERDSRTMNNHNLRPEVVLARQQGLGENIRYSNTLSEEMLYVAVPLNESNREGYILRQALPLAKIQETLNVIYRSVFTILSITLLLAGVAGFYFLRRTLRPVNEICEVAEAVSKGNWSLKAPANIKGEIGHLARTFNQMIEELSLRLQALTHQKEKIETVLKGMQEGVIALDSDNRIRECNRAAAMLLNLEDTHRGSILSTNGRRPEWPVVFEKVRHTKTTQKFDVELNSKTLEFRVTPLDQEEEVLVVIRDITEAARYESLRREFVGNVSHELRTPLSIAIGYIETLLEGAIDEPREARKFIETTDRNLRQLTNLVDDLLVLSRLESESEHPEMANLDIKPLIYSALGDLESLVKKKDQRVVYDFQKELAPIRGDAELLDRVFKNLIDNAVKYTPRGGTLTIAANNLMGKVYINISDSGIGIPEKDIPRLFERFFRVDKSRSREMGGTGLGLSIVKHIIQLHGGTVTAKSKIGIGSTFQIELPTVNSQPQPVDHQLNLGFK